MSKKKNTIIKEKIHIWRKAAAILSAIIIAFLVWQVFYLRAEIAEIREVTTEQTTTATTAADFVIDFGTDLNEIRELLLLPTKSYTLFDAEDYVPEEEEEESVISDMFTYISQIGLSRTIEEKQAALDEYFALEETQTLLTDNDLTRLEDTYEIQDSSQRTLLTIAISEDDAQYTLTNHFDESIEITTSIESTLESEITNISTLTTRIDTLTAARSNIATILYESGEAGDALTLKGMWAEAEYDTDSAYEYYLVNQDQTRLASLTLSKTDPETVTWLDLTTGESQPIDIDDATIATLIEPLDASTSLEQKITENREKLESLIADPAFLQALTDNEVQMAEAWEDDEGIYYDIKDLEDNTLSTIYIDKNTGKVMVRNADASETLELMAAVATDSSKKKLWICLKRSQSTVMS